MYFGSAPSRIDLSIIAPARNEEANIGLFIDDIAAAFKDSKISFELIIVDDRSTDSTATVATSYQQSYPWLRVLRIIQRSGEDRDCGKSAALFSGIQMALGAFIAFIDADRQNDAGDVPRMLQLLRTSDVDMIHGDRSKNRNDNWIRRFSTTVALRIRQFLLKDQIRDSACGIQVMTQALAKVLPLQFAGMHRFLPCYAILAGYRVLQAPVAHHPRRAGKSKYTFRNRAIRSLVDMLVLRWMSTRFKIAPTREVHPTRTT